MEFVLLEESRLIWIENRWRYHGLSMKNRWPLLAFMEVCNCEWNCFPTANTIDLVDHNRFCHKVYLMLHKKLRINVFLPQMFLQYWPRTWNPGIVSPCTKSVMIFWQAYVWLLWWYFIYLLWDFVFFFTEIVYKLKKKNLPISVFIFPFCWNRWSVVWSLLWRYLLDCSIWLVPTFSTTWWPIYCNWRWWFEPQTCPENIWCNSSCTTLIQSFILSVERVSIFFFIVLVTKTFHVFFRLCVDC